MPAADVTALRVLLAGAGLPLPAPVVALVGGAGGMDAVDWRRCSALISGVLVPFAEEHGVCIVDGGTDAGVMAIAGQARQELGARQPHVGVVAAGTVLLPASDRPAPSVRAASAQTRVDHEPHHTHLVVVPGDTWGDESPWIGAVTAALSGPLPSVTVLANGGEIARRDLRESVRLGRPVLVLAGTGRAADDVAAAPAGGRSQLVEVVGDAGGLAVALARHLTPGG
jgi:hypothetical protein